MRQDYAFSERRACGLMTMAVSSYRYPTRRNDEPLRTRLVELAREKPRFGYRRLHILLGRSGEHVNHKRVHRVYREAGLMIRRKKRKHCVRVGQPLRTWTAGDPAGGWTRGVGVARRFCARVRRRRCRRRARRVSSQRAR